MDATELITAFADLFRQSYHAELSEQARKGNPWIPVDFSDIAKFNPDVADYLLDTPEEALKAAQLAIEQIDLPGEKKGWEMRVRNLPLSQKVMVRDVRSKHIGKLHRIDGVVRQKSDVRPLVTTAKFECPSCGNVMVILQLDASFKEPTKCGCGRKGKFRMISKELCDAQRVVLEEIPEEIEGGAQPKRMNVFLKNDLVSPFTEKKTNPGSKIMVTGMVKEIPIFLKTGGQSTRFDLIIESNQVEPIGEEFSELSLSPEEEQKIKEIAQSPRRQAMLTQSLAPSIYGHEKIKESLLLQMVGGVRKTRNDGVVTRGDMHILLIGDPGSGKCLVGDTKIPLSDGSISTIKDIVEGKSKSKINVIQRAGRLAVQTPARYWKRKSPKHLLKIRTQSGKEVLITKEHPLFTLQQGMIVASPAHDLKTGQFIAAPRKLDYHGAVQSLPTVFDRSRSRNQQALKFPKNLTKEFARLLGYLLGDGYVSFSKTSGWVSLTNSNVKLIDDFSKLIKDIFNGHTSTRISKGKTASDCYIMSLSLVNFLKAISEGIVATSAHKRIPQAINKSRKAVLREFLRALFECEAHINLKKGQVEFTTISRHLAEDVQTNLLKFGIITLFKQKMKYAANTLNKRRVPAYELIISGEQAESFVKQIGFISKEKSSKSKSLCGRKRNTNIDVIPQMSEILKLMRKRLGLYQKHMGVPRTTYTHYERADRNPSRTSFQKVIETVQNQVPHDEYLQMLRQLAHADIFWDKIISISTVNATDAYVYDLEIKDNHNFVANNIVVHNSQLLKRIQKIAPKVRFVSGKGASGAGLSAAVVKDEFLQGWSLEAGALVLANKGMLLLDELDKMSKDDASALHEGLEQQTISIAKANIQATLVCETTVLAAANPKFGRFDPYEPVARQIELPSTLINRFDLIFPIKDLPDPQRDGTMAAFILNLHQNRGEVNTEIDTALLRKYLAYAKRYNPGLTDDAMEALKEYYMKMRQSGSNERGSRSIPISARQLEGLVRMTEASARLRLSDKAEKSDALKAIELMDFCLRQVAFDEETGTFDIDRVSSDTTASERNKIGAIKEIFAELEKLLGQVVPAEDIGKMAKERGIESSEVDEILEKMKRKGDVYEPRAGFYSRLG